MGTFEVSIYKNKRFLGTTKAKNETEAREELLMKKLDGKLFGTCDRIFLDQVNELGEITEREVYDLFNLRWGRMLVHPEP